MSKSNDKAIEEYVSKKMPAKVKKALADAKYSLHYGPSGGGGMGWVKASKIVEDWWDRNMGDDLVVDDAGNVVTSYEFEKYLHQIQDERYKEAFQEAIDEGIDEDDIHDHAEREAKNYAEGSVETSTTYDSSDVKRLILGKDWP